MSGLDKILEYITQEANAEADKIIASAQEEAAAIISSEKKKADDQSAAIMKQAESDAAAQATRIESAAQMKEKRILLQAKQDKIDEVFALAKEQLLGLDDEKYFEMIQKMIQKYASGESGQIKFSQRDLDRIPAALKEQLEDTGLLVSSEPADIDGGFILSYGDIEENCSIDVLISESREALQDKISETLFN
jgi:V/A-type H+/Na+-transporting ATPase subunit E